MTFSKIDTPAAPDTIAELRDLYRAAEARAARLRLLIEAGRDLSSVDPDELERSLATNARRAALFAGLRDGRVSFDKTAAGLPLIAPGAENRRVGTLIFSDTPNPATVYSEEDREALDMLAQLIAAAIDRAARDKERDLLLAKLQEREQHLEQMIERLFTAQEDERRYISRELHDGVAQTATALYRHLDAQTSVNSGTDSHGAKLANIAKGLVRELRSVIAGLRPTVLDDLGLIPAIETLADDLQADGYQVSVSLETQKTCPTTLTAPFFRIAQEALSNIRKHAGDPCRVEIAFKHQIERNCWMLYIRDYGQGMQNTLTEQPEKGQHVGMEMMRERMTALGGTLDVKDANPGISITAMAEGGL